MSARGAALAAAIGGVLGAPVATPAALAEGGGYHRDARLDHLRRALAALDELGPRGRHALELELHQRTRSACGTGGARIELGCMIATARAVCAARPGCLAAADVIVTNHHAEPDLVDEATRMRLVQISSDYHAAVGAELWARYALLAAELALADLSGEPAAQIDQFCVERDRTIHACEPDAKGCVPSLPYQRCVAGLAWFVANHEEAR